MKRRIVEITDTNDISRKTYRLTVITSDAQMAANVGGTVFTKTRTFELPQEIQDYIASQMGMYMHVTFGLEQTP